MSNLLKDPTQKVSHGPGDALVGLKIALQVLSHDGLRILVPALATLLGVVTCAGLFVWSWVELQNFDPESIAVSHKEPSIDVVDTITKSVVPVASTPSSTPVRKAKKKSSRKARVVNRAPRKVARYSEDDLIWAQDNPSGGRVIRADSCVTEYAWDTKRSR